MLFFNFAWKPMPPFWDCLKILMGTFTIFWSSWTDSFRIQQIDSFRFLGQIFTPVGNSAMEIPKWIGSSDIDCITHLQYDKLWGLPRRVFTLFESTGLFLLSFLRSWTKLIIHPSIHPSVHNSSQFPFFPVGWVEFQILIFQVTRFLKSNTSRGLETPWTNHSLL